MARPSASESTMSSTHAVQISKMTTNGNRGVITSVLWLVVAAGLCFPWLLERPEKRKAGATPRSVAWYVMLVIDLLLSMLCVFSLWFRKSAMSTLLLIWGSFCILATFLLGSFAMLPAVATMCCCAPELCTVAAADVTALDIQFCYVPLDLCMTTPWPLWCFYGGILLAMVAMVLLVNSVSFHRVVLLDTTRQQKIAAKAARSSSRARCRRQDMWEQDVYEHATRTGRTLQSSSPLTIAHDWAPTHRIGRLDSLLVAPASRSPSVSPSSSASVAAGGPDANTTLPAPSAPCASLDGMGVEEDPQRQPSANSTASSSTDGGLLSRHGSNDGCMFPDGTGGVGDEEEGRRVQRCVAVRQKMEGNIRGAVGRRW